MYSSSLSAVNLPSHPLSRALSRGHDTKRLDPHSCAKMAEQRKLPSRLQRRSGSKGVVACDQISAVVKDNLHNLGRKVFSCNQHLPAYATQRRDAIMTKWTLAKHGHDTQTSPARKQPLRAKDVVGKKTAVSRCHGEQLGTEPVERSSWTPATGQPCSKRQIDTKGQLAVRTPWQSAVSFVFETPANRSVPSVGQCPCGMSSRQEQKCRFSHRSVSFRKTKARAH